MNTKYISGAILAIPLLPILYYQSKRVRASVPKLPEAIEPAGTCLFDKQDKKVFRLLTLGESTMAGVGVETHQEGFGGTLASELSRLLEVNVKWRVYAHSGYTAQNVYESILPEIVEKQADLIVIGLGANDAFSLHSPDRWRKNMTQLISALQARFPNVPIVFCNMPPIKDFPAFTPLLQFFLGNLVEMLGEELSRLVEQYDQVYFSSEVITLANWIKKLDNGLTKSDFFSDGVHPSKLTYQTWAKDLAAFISKLESNNFPLLENKS